MRSMVTSSAAAEQDHCRRSPGYPHLTVPMALVKGLPVGLSFIGPKWSEAKLLSLGYAYEQARGTFPTPKFYRSIEESSQLAALLQPQP